MVQTPILNLSICVGLNPAKVFLFFPASTLPLCVNNNESALLKIIGPVNAPFKNGKKSLFLLLALMSFPSSVKTANKKAEKSKKSALKTPNSIPEGEGQFSSIKEGE